MLEKSDWVNVLTDDTKKPKTKTWCLCFQDFAIQVIKSTHNHWKDLIYQKAKAGELCW